MNPISSLVGGNPSLTPVSGNGLNAAGGGVPTAPGTPGSAAGGGMMPIPHGTVSATFDVNMASSVTLACCQSLCDVLTELPLPTAIVDKSSHTRSLISGLNVNMATRNTLLNDLQLIPHLHEALYMAKQQLENVNFITSTTNNQQQSSSTTVSPSNSNNSADQASNQSTNNQPSQLLHELLARGCFLNSQLPITGSGSSSSTPSATTGPAPSSIYSNTQAASSNNQCSSNNNNSASNSSNDLMNASSDLHSIEPSIDVRHMTDFHPNLMNDLINDDCCDPTSMSSSTTTTANATAQAQPHHYSSSHPVEHHTQNHQQHHSVLTQGSGAAHHQQHHQTHHHQHYNDYTQLNHHAQQQSSHGHHTNQYQQQQQSTTMTRYQQENQNNKIASSPDNYSSLGERVKSRQREAAQKAIAANSAAFGGQQQPQAYYQQQQQQQSQIMSNNSNSQVDLQQHHLGTSSSHHPETEQPLSYNSMTVTNKMNHYQITPNNQQQQPTTTPSTRSSHHQSKKDDDDDDKDWQLPQSSSLSKKSTRNSITTAPTFSSESCTSFRKTAVQQPPPIRRTVIDTKPQIRSVKYSFSDIDYGDSLLNSSTVDIVVRFEQIVDQILSNSCNDFNEFYGEYNDNDNSDNESSMMNNTYGDMHGGHINEMKRYHNQQQNKKKKLKTTDVISNHVNGMSFNVSIDADQLKEIMILSAKLKQTNRVMEIERKKLILFLNVLSNQLNIWLTRYKSKASALHNHNSSAGNSSMDDDPDEESTNEEERQRYWELCCNASQSALHIMTSSSPNQSDKASLISLEELIEVIVDFLSNNLSAATHVITTKLPSKSKSSSHHHQQQHHFGVSKRHVTRWTQLLQLLFEFITLRTKGSLTDTLILSLTRISMSALFLLQSTAEMQFVSIEILCHVFEEYHKHRMSILEELLNSLSKIPTHKKSHRKDSVLTQMLIRLTNAFFQPDITHTKETLLTQSQSAMQIITGFLSHFFRKCYSSSSSANSDVDFRVIFEALLTDLLETFHSPHSTSSIMITQIIIKMLISYLSQNSQQKGQNISLGCRLLAIDYLSILCSKFAQFMAEKDEVVKELTKTFSTIEDVDMKPNKKNKQKQQEQQNSEAQFIQKIWTHLTNYFNTEKLYREKLVLASMWIKEKYYAEQEQNEQQFLQKLNQSKFNDDDPSTGGSVVDISTASLCIQYMEFVQFSINNRLFGISISCITASLGSSANTTQRSRAMKSLSNILSSCTIERATEILSRSDIQQAMRCALLDSSTSVREATVDLLGRFVLQSKDQSLCQRYSDLIGLRILDTGISVRKRVIKILRDFCIEFPEYEKCGEMAVRIVRRINDDGEGIRRLVVETCRDLWFTNSNTAPIKYRVHSLLHVIANMLNNESGSMDSMQSLFDQLIKTDTMPIAQQICDCIMNDVLINDMAQTNKRTQLSAVQCVAMMAQCCPELMVTHCDTLQSLLSLPCETIIEISLRVRVIQTIERILPHIHNPSPTLMTRIEEDLTKNILQSSANILQWAVKCLSVLIKNHTKNTKLAVDLFCKFQQILYQYRNLLYEGHIDQLFKPKLLRAIYTCGLFAKYFSAHLTEYKDRVRDTFIQMILEQYDSDIKTKSIVALGFVIESEPKICLLPQVIEIYSGILRNEHLDNRNESFCIQVLNNFRNYLSESIESDENAVKTIEWARESLKSMQSSEDDSSSTQSQIIQKYLSSILINALNPILAIRRVACNVIHVIHSGGHVHPLQLVPHLVAMTCDDDYQIRIRADLVLHDIERKYHGYVAMKAKEAVNLSALFCKKLNCSGYRILAEKNSPATQVQDGQNLISMPVTNKEICSRLSTLYQVICTNRQSRRGFITSLLRHFETSELLDKNNAANQQNNPNIGSIATPTHQTERIDIEFVVENVLFFPYAVFDEILYILNQLECTSSINATNVTQMFKEIFIVDKTNDQPPPPQPPLVQQFNIQIPEIPYPPPPMYDHMGNINHDYLIYQQQQQQLHQQALIRQQQQFPPEPTVVDIEDIDLENEDQFKKYENNIHVNFDLLFSDSQNARLMNLVHSLRIIYLSTLLRTLLKEFYLLKDEKINDYSTNDAKAWEKPIHRRQMESTHLKELFNIAKPNIASQESLLLSNDLQEVEKQLLYEWKRFRQVSLNNIDPNFKPSIIAKLFQNSKSSSSTSLSSAALVASEESSSNVNIGDQAINSNNGMGQFNEQQESITTLSKPSRSKSSDDRMVKINNSSKKSKQKKKKRRRVVINEDDESESDYDDDDYDEDYHE